MSVEVISRRRLFMICFCSGFLVLNHDSHEETMNTINYPAIDIPSYFVTVSVIGAEKRSSWTFGLLATRASGAI